MYNNINDPIQILEDAKRQLEELLSSVNHTIEDNKNNHTFVKNGVDSDEAQGWINQFNNIIRNLDGLVETLEKFKESSDK